MNLVNDLLSGSRSIKILINIEESVFRVMFIDPKMQPDSILTENDKVTQIDECRFMDMIDENHSFVSKNKIPKLFLASLIPKNKLKGRIKKVFIKKNGKIIELNIDK